MKFMRKIVACAGVVAMALSFAACGGSSASTNNGAASQSASSSSTTKELKKVTFMLAWVPDTNHIGVYVAKNKGYFKDAGLDVDIIAVGQNGAEHAVSTGQADFALSNLTNAASYSLKGAGIIQTLQVQQKPSAVWCALASNTAIKSPKDFDGKTFATFGSNESDAVIRRMIQADGGKGEFDKVTVGTNTFQTLTSGQADFGGFYATWEGVQAEMYGPKLNCFTEPEYGVPGNADGIGIITSQKLIDSDPDTVRAFTQAAQKGYEYAYDNPDEAAQILVDDAGDSTLQVDFVKRSMQVITEGQYWGDKAKIKDGSFVLGTNTTDEVQPYLDFIAEADAFTDANDKVVKTAPKAADVSTNEFLAK